jgi:hypothetical protein
VPANDNVTLTWKDVAVIDWICAPVNDKIPAVGGIGGDTVSVRPDWKLVPLTEIVWFKALTVGVLGETLVIVGGPEGVGVGGGVGFGVGVGLELPPHPMPSIVALAKLASQTRHPR